MPGVHIRRKDQDPDRHREDNVKALEEDKHLQAEEMRQEKEPIVLTP